MKGFSLGILTIVALFLATSCGSNNAAEQKPAAAAVPVNVYTVAEQSITGIDKYPATVVPLNEVELRAEVTGTITGIYVQDGQTVTKGQKLYEIDRSKYLANYKQAQAQVKAAESTLEQAKRDAERYERLQQKDAVARHRDRNAERERDQQTEHRLQSEHPEQRGPPPPCPIHCTTHRCPPPLSVTLHSPHTHT